MSPRMRLAWFGAVAFVVLFGLGELGGWIAESLRGPAWWAIDLQLVLDAGKRFAAGEPIYADPRFLYPPVAALAGSILLPVDARLVSGAYVLVKLGIAAACVRAFTGGWPPLARVLAFAGIVGSLPFLHDVMLGNANVLLVGAMALAVARRPSPGAGVALGVVTAVFAKPLVLPFLLWLLLYRRATLAGTLIAGLTVTGVGVVIAGVPAHLDWAGALVAGGRFASPFAGNHGLSAIAPALWAPVAAATAIGYLVVLVRRGAGVGLVWAVTSGILLAPYAGTYSALPIVVALPFIGGKAPRLCLAVVALSPIATTHPLPVYAAAILLAALTLRDGPDRAGSEVGSRDRALRMPPAGA